jgi:hypothetical protein
MKAASRRQADLLYRGGDRRGAPDCALIRPFVELALSTRSGLSLHVGIGRA